MEYGLNNPVKYNDPSGHFAWVAVGAIGGAIGGAIYGYGSQVISNLNSGMDICQAMTSVDGGQVAQYTLAGTLIGTGIGGVAAATEAIVTTVTACAATNCVSQAEQAIQNGLNAVQNGIGQGY